MSRAGIEELKAESRVRLRGYREIQAGAMASQYQHPNSTPCWSGKLVCYFLEVKGQREGIWEKEIGCHLDSDFCSSHSNTL
jgi:hypothetical protein